MLQQKRFVHRQLWVPRRSVADVAFSSSKKLRKSVFALQELSPELEKAVRALYCDALRIAFAASSAFALLAFLFSLAHRTGSLQRKSETQAVSSDGEDNKDGTGR